MIFLSLLAIGLVPKATCQETNTVHIRADISIGDINFSEGKLTFSGLYLSVDVNNSFGVYLFAPSAFSHNYWDESSHVEEGWYFLGRHYFPNGMEVKFNFKEWVFHNEVLEYDMVIGLNVTANGSALLINTDLNLQLKDEWDVNGTIAKVSKEEASRYAIYGMSAINSSIRMHNIREFYLLRIQVNRKFNIENVVLWLPPFFMLLLLLASILLVYRKDLANSLRVYLAVVFFSFSYLSMLKEITPPIMTSIEAFTLFDATFCLFLAIIAILIHFLKPLAKA